MPWCDRSMVDLCIEIHRQMTPAAARSRTAPPASRPPRPGGAPPAPPFPGLLRLRGRLLDQRTRDLRGQLELAEERAHPPGGVAHAELPLNPLLRRPDAGERLRGGMRHQLGARRGAQLRRPPPAPAGAMLPQRRDAPLAIPGQPRPQRAQMDADEARSCAPGAGPPMLCYPPAEQRTMIPARS